MEKYTVVPPRDQRKTYDAPEIDKIALYFVLNKTTRARRVTTLSVFIRKAILDWAPNNVIRVEGYTETASGKRGVLGYYKLHSTDNRLGELQVQDI